MENFHKWKIHSSTDVKEFFQTLKLLQQKSIAVVERSVII